MRVVEQLLLEPSGRIYWRSWVSIEGINHMRHAIGRRTPDQEVRHVRRDAPANQSLSATAPPRSTVQFAHWPGYIRGRRRLFEILLGAF